jgi:hypothetical protein
MMATSIEMVAGVLLSDIAGRVGGRIVNSSLPATTTSLGVLATPVVGIVVSAIALGEKVDTDLLVSVAMIILERVVNF